MRRCVRYLRRGVLIMLDIQWRPRAHLDRESIALYLGCEQGKPEAALAAMKHIDNTLQRIQKFPDSGSHVRLEGLHRNDYRRALADPYAIYYRFDENTLTVYRILHQRQDIDTYTLVDL